MPEIAMAEPMIVLRSIASWNTMADTTIMMTRLAVLRTEEVTDPTNAVKAKATYSSEKNVRFATHTLFFSFLFLQNVDQHSTKFRTSL